MKNTFIFLFALLISQSAFSYNVTGNGGFGVSCMSQGHKKIYILEEYEISFEKNLQLIAQGRNEIKINWAEGQTLDEKVQQYIFRSQDLAQDELTAYYQSLRLVFAPRAVVNVADTNKVIKNGCQQILIAFQFVTNDQDRVVVIDQAIWKNLTLDQQALLVFHEVVYGYFIKNSRGTGRFDSSEARQYIKNILTISN